ncbi:MAG TPA: hypothetical protein PKM69_08610, partial [Bacteroidales bacterium]|nr:hypothetical protein [Bacteroidales bacterium]
TGKQYHSVGSPSWSDMKSDLGWQTHEPGLVDPVFVSTEDQHLQVGSPDIGAGIAISGITEDHDGNKYTSPPNIGCYANSVTTPDP